MLVKFNPIDSLVRNDRFFDDFFNTDFAPVERGFDPEIDVKENEKEYVIQAELAGLDKKDFSVKVENNVLVIAGDKKQEDETKDGSFYRVERRYGSFQRSFRLTDSVAADKIKADFRNGILTVTIPKIEKAKPKEIAVEVK